MISGLVGPGPRHFDLMEQVVPLLGKVAPPLQERLACFSVVAAPAGGCPIEGPHLVDGEQDRRDDDE